MSGRLVVMALALTACAPKDSVEARAGTPIATPAPAVAPASDSPAADTTARDTTPAPDTTRTAAATPNATPNATPARTPRAPQAPRTSTPPIIGRDSVIQGVKTMPAPRDTTRPR